MRDNTIQEEQLFWKLYHFYTWMSNLQMFFYNMPYDNAQHIPYRVCADDHFLYIYYLFISCDKLTFILKAK